MEGFNTRAARAPRVPPLPLEPIAPSLHLATNFRTTSSAQLGELFRKKSAGVYPRFRNSGLSGVEARLAELEGGEDALVFPSGMSAITTTLLALLKAGDHVVAQQGVFAQTATFLSEILPRFGVHSTTVSGGDPVSFGRALTESTRIVYLETPSNPMLDVVDIAVISQAVRSTKPGLLVLVDNTFATPYLQNPLQLGASLVLHSASKYLGGHADLLAGAVVGARDLVRPIWETQYILGGIMDPHGASLLMRGMRTLGLRVQRSSDTCLALAQFLQGQPGISAVHYPWLTESRSHRVAKKQMRGGGGLLSFEVAGGLAQAQRFVDALQLVTIATSLGGIESVVEVPSELDWHESEGAAVGAVPPGLVRLSVGIEDLEDLRADLHRGLSAINPELQRRPNARAMSVP